MPAVVDLSDILEAIELQPRDGSSVLDPESGEIFVFTEEELRYAEDPELDLESLPDWQRDLVEKVLEVERTGRYVRLPDSFDVHEWSIMRGFCDSVQDPGGRAELLDAVHGSGAFRLFKSTVARLNLEEDWFAYRKQALESIAVRWLEGREIPFRVHRPGDEPHGEAR